MKITLARYRRLHRRFIFFTEIVRYFTRPYGMRVHIYCPPVVLFGTLYSRLGGTTTTHACTGYVSAFCCPSPVCVTPFATSSPKSGIACFVFGTGKKYSEIIDTSPRMDGRRVYILLYYGRHNNTTPRSHARATVNYFVVRNRISVGHFLRVIIIRIHQKIRRLAHITQIYVIGVYIKK